MLRKSPYLKKNSYTTLKNSFKRSLQEKSYIKSHTDCKYL